jgi:hypothetical protein
MFIAKEVHICKEIRENIHFSEYFFGILNKNV